jgi:hypothetical protein
MRAQRLIAALFLPTPVPKVLEAGDAMLAKVLASTLLSSCTTPTPTAFKSDLDALRTAQAAKGSGPAAIEARDLALKQVRRDMRNFLVFVQQNADANEAQAANIITSAGMFIKKVVVRDTPDLAIRQGATSGTAIARAKSRGRGATYWWAFSADEKTWIVVPATRKATASFANLTPGMVYYFRFQALTKAGLSDWSQIVSFMVK